MRFFLAVSWSILKARLSLSAVSSSTELLAVLTSKLSRLRRSMTSALSMPRSRASWKTRTLCISLLTSLDTCGRARLGLALLDDRRLRRRLARFVLLVLLRQHTRAKQQVRPQPRGLGRL